MATNQSKYGSNLDPLPQSILDRCGWGGAKLADAAIQEIGATFSPFIITGCEPGFTGANSTAKLWEVFISVTGEQPDLTPQPTGNCVSCAADDALELLQAIQIATGASKVWKPIYSPFHYGTGRVLVGKNRIRGPGSLNSWQTRALLDHGSLILTPDRPKYTKGNVDAWGDDKKADDGTGFRDFMEEAKTAILKDAAVIERWEQLRDGLKAGHPGTIAGTTGYSMKPNADGFHTVSGDWPHEMSIWGYSEEGKNPWVVLKNQWGDCHSADTEVLTRDGWKLFSALTDSDELATLNPKTWEMEYQFATARQDHQFDGDLVHVRGRNVDMLVTPGHRMYMCPSGGDRTQKDRWSFRTADKLPKHLFIKKDMGWTGKHIETMTLGKYEIPAEVWFAFMGYYLSEGSTSAFNVKNISTAKRNKGLKVLTGTSHVIRTVSIAQDDPAACIQDCLDALPFKFGSHSGHQWAGCNKTLGNYLKQYGKARDKFIPQYIKDATPELIRIFFEAAMFGDGTDTKASCVYYTSSKRMADDMQEIVLKCGWSADVSFVNRIGRDNGSGGVTRDIEYRVNIKKMQKIHQIKHKDVRVPYSGRVYCATVPNGTLLTRRNGQASWSGNCMGTLIDFDTDKPLPKGFIRVRLETFINQHLRRPGTETFVYSAFEGFPQLTFDTKGWS